MGEIVSSIFKAACLLLQAVVCLALQWMASGIIGGSFTPSLDAFVADSGAVFTPETFEYLLNAFKYAGYSLIVVLLFFHFLFFLVGSAVDIKDSLGQTAIRLFVCLGLVFSITSFFDVFLDYAKQLAVDLFNPVMNLLIRDLGIKSEGHNAAWGGIFDVHADFSDPAFNYIDLAYFSTGNTAAVEIFKLILQIVFFGIVAYNFAKLCVELVKRYMVMCSLYTCSPLAVPFFITAETQNVLFSFVKMFACEIGIVVFTRLWILVCLHTMSTLVCTFINMCIMIALVQFGLKIETLLKEMGFTTANMGGALLDNIAATGVAMSMIVKNSTGFAGETLINAGGAVGSMGLTTIGSALTGKPMSLDGRARSMTESAGAQLRASFTKSSSLSNLTNSQKQIMDDAISNAGLFRNQTLQGMLRDLNNHGYQEAMHHITENTLGNVSEKLGKANAVVTPLSYSQNNGIGFQYKSGINGVTRNGYISDTPKASNGGMAIPLTMENGKMAYINLEPQSMADLHNSGVDAYYNAEGEILGDELTSMELDTGMHLDQFVYGGDVNATHYAAVPNNTGGVDIRYSENGINTMNLNESQVVGAVTQNGYQLKTTDYEWGNHSSSPEKDIHETLTTGTWSNMGLTDINPHDISLDKATGAIQFTATDIATEKRSSYTAIPSVYVQDRVTPHNTRTDSAHGSYTFSRLQNKSASNLNKNAFSGLDKSTTKKPKL